MFSNLGFTEGNVTVCDNIIHAIPSPSDVIQVLKGGADPPRSTFQVVFEVFRVFQHILEIVDIFNKRLWVPDLQLVDNVDEFVISYAIINHIRL